MRGLRDRIIRPSAEELDEIRNARKNLTIMPFKGADAAYVVVSRGVYRDKVYPEDGFTFNPPPTFREITDIMMQVRSRQSKDPKRKIAWFCLTKDRQRIPERIAFATCAAPTCPWPIVWRGLNRGQEWMEECVPCQAIRDYFHPSDHDDPESRGLRAQMVEHYFNRIAGYIA